MTAMDKTGFLLTDGAIAPGSALAAEAARLDVLRRGDAKALAACLDDHFQFIHHNARVDSKDVFVTKLGNGDLVYGAVGWDKVWASEGPEVGNIVYDFRATLIRKGRPDEDIVRRVLAVWRRAGQGWLLVALTMVLIG